MNSGPACKTGFDLSLTEIKLNPSHYFIIEVGSVMGEKIISKLKLLLAYRKRNISWREFNRTK